MFHSELHFYSLRSDYCCLQFVQASICLPSSDLFVWHFV